MTRQQQFIVNLRDGIGGFLAGYGGPEVVQKMYEAGGADVMEAMCEKVRTTIEIECSCPFSEAEWQEIRSVIAGAFGLV